MLAAGYAVLFVLGVAIGVYGAFLVPLRLFGGVEGLADVIGFAGLLCAGYFGAVGFGGAPAAVVPGGVGPGAPRAPSSPASAGSCPCCCSATRPVAMW